MKDIGMPSRRIFSLIFINSECLTPQNFFFLQIVKNLVIGQLFNHFEIITCVEPIGFTSMDRRNNTDIPSKFWHNIYSYGEIMIIFKRSELFVILRIKHRITR